MHVITSNDVKVYEITSTKSFPYWLDYNKRKKVLKDDPELEHRVELLQDFDMPTSTTSISITQDRNFLLTAGIYKPRIRCHDLSEMSMKFERCTDSESNLICNQVLKFISLSEDYAKLVLLLKDRFLEFHAQDGLYYRTRIPSFGRDFAYDICTCDLNILSDNNCIYRLNLESGQFMQPYHIENQVGSSIIMNDEYHFITVGTEQGYLWAFDPRSKGSICAVNMGSQFNAGVTALSYRDTLNFGVGFSNGIVALYDIRSDKPLVHRDHMYGDPINKILFRTTINDDDLVFSSDHHSLKIWERSDSKIYTCIEPTTSINDFCIYPNSGLILLANESPKSSAFLVPSIGSAPKWCMHLDNITEELEEITKTQLYDDYKFITSQELDEIGLSSLIGTDSLRAYMHGYLINHKIYKNAKSAYDPLTYKEYQKKTTRQQILESRMDRLKLVKMPTVNKSFAEQLLNTKAKINNNDVINPIGDERFIKMFQNPDYEIESENEHYKLLNNHRGKTKPKEKPIDVGTVESDSSSDESEIENEIQHYEEPNISIKPFTDERLLNGRDKPLTLEEKLHSNPCYSNGQPNVFGDQEIHYFPKNDKANKQKTVIRALKNHVAKRRQFSNSTRLNIASIARNIFKRNRFNKK